MKYKPIIIVGGEPNSIFLEILFKSLKQTKNKSPLILIISVKLFKLQMKKLNFSSPFQLINFKKISFDQINNKKINLINVNYNCNKAFDKITTKSNNYIENCFEIALKLMESNISNKFINGPISKKHFLKNKFLGITEYLAHKTKSKNVTMLIYTKNLSVMPLTTHLPIKLVTRYITKKLIIKKIILINNFYEKYLGIKPRIAVTGINPHCESISAFNEDSKIVKPAIKYLKKKIDINGPFSADTIFVKKNRSNYNLIVGMYHDQVLTPIKTLYEYNAINITVGLPFIRISPDHGPNEKMLGKNISNPQSLIQALKFLDF